MNAFSIYLITNSINDKVYVGKTKRTVEARWSAHKTLAKTGKDLRFYRALRKYGFDAFVVSTLEDNLTAQQADVLERLWILTLRSTVPEFGYNTTFGGDGGCLTDEAKQKISAASRRSWADPDTRARLLLNKAKLFGEDNPMFGRHDLGKPHTDETKQKLSDIRAQLFQDPDFKERMAVANTGKHHTDEGRANISAALQGNQYRTGIPHDEATKQKVSESVKRAYAEGRHRIVCPNNKGRKLGPMSEAERQKRSDGVKRARAEKFWSTRKKTIDEVLVEACVPAPSALDVGPASL